MPIILEPCAEIAVPTAADCATCSTPANAASTDVQIGCPSDATCAASNVFTEVRVMPTIKHGTIVEWNINPALSDPGPYIFELQVGRTGLPGADDWETVGAPAENASAMTDDTQRVYGKTQWTHYRVKLTTSVDVYYSQPKSALGELSFKDRNIWLSMFKAQQKLLVMEEGVEGYLLKRRLFGEVCPNDCRDYVTEEVTNPQCEQCYGTGFIGGYFAPLGCVYAALSPKATRNQLDGGNARGTIDDELRVKARMMAVPQLFSYDVWVEKNNDHRWAVHKITHKVEYKGVAVVLDVELRLLPFSDPVYSIEVP